MNNDITCYVDPYDRNKDATDKKVVVLTPWTVQSICYELIANYMLSNPPKTVGYNFEQVYTTDKFKTGIYLDIANHYDDSVVQKRPAIFVFREGAGLSYPTMNQLIGADTAESKKTKLSIVSMPLGIAVIATNVGFVEQLAEYVAKCFLQFEEQVRNDFCLRRFKLVNIGKPQIYQESKDHMIMVLNLDVVFDMGWVVKGDHLKLKTVSTKIFTACSCNPLENQ